MAHGLTRRTALSSQSHNVVMSSSRLLAIKIYLSTIIDVRINITTIRADLADCLVFPSCVISLWSEFLDIIQDDFMVSNSAAVLNRVA